MCFGSGLEVTVAWASGLSSEKAAREGDARVQRPAELSTRKAKARCVLGWSWHVQVQLDFSKFPEALEALPGAPVGEINASWLFRMKLEKYLHYVLALAMVRVWEKKSPLAFGGSLAPEPFVAVLLLFDTERRSKLGILLPLERPSKPFTREMQTLSLPWKQFSLGAVPSIRNAKVCSVYFMQSRLKSTSHFIWLPAVDKRKHIEI